MSWLNSVPRWRRPFVRVTLLGGGVVDEHLQEGAIDSDLRTGPCCRF